MADGFQIVQVMIEISEFKKKNFKHLQLFDYRDPCKRTVTALKKYKHKRHISLSDLATEMLGNDNFKSSFCLWCGSTEFQYKRRRYCSSYCTDSAHTYCYPQSPGSKAFILIERQEFCCKFCGLSYEDQIDKFIPRQVQRNKEYNIRSEKYEWQVKISEKVTYFQIGSLIGSLMDLDHIKPIHWGGDGIGLKNVQVICCNCHKIKTKRDIQGGKK